MTRKLNYRLFQEADLPSLLQLWAENTSWGTLSEQTWREWYRNTPFGDCIVAVAEDEEGRIAAQEVLTPCQVCFGGQVGLAARVSAPVLRKDQRQRLMRGPDHPAWELLNIATNAARDQGIGVLYTLPDPSWLPIIRKIAALGLPNLTYETTEFPCLALTLADVHPPGTSRSPFEGAIVHPFRGSEYETLWQQAVAGWPLSAAVTRLPRWLNWRQGGYLVVETRNCSTGSLVGYGVVNRSTGLLMDLLACDSDHLEPVLEQTICQVCTHRQAELEAGVDQLKAMAIPAISKALENQEFNPVDYLFGFGVHLVEGGWATGLEIAPKDWYITPGD